MKKYLIICASLFSLSSHSQEKITNSQVGILSECLLYGNWSSMHIDRLNLFERHVYSVYRNNLPLDLVSLEIIKGAELGDRFGSLIMEHAGYTQKKAGDVLWSHNKCEHHWKYTMRYLAK